MSFNLFGPASKSDIRVGYIDPERGFVGDLTLCDANKYAKLNPGTTFILRRRDKIKFLNINEVNKLEGKDLLPATSATGSKGCDGVTGLDIYDEDGNIKPELFEEIPPNVRFSGGGGIGAKANPIFGNDGSLLAVDVIDGGWGYQYAPVTEVFDEYGIGSGAVIRSIMIGDPGYPDCKFLNTVETFEREEDFEEYDLSQCSSSSRSFGKRYDENGNEAGAWDPTIYANLDNDPIKIEIQRYQDFLLSLRKGQKINIDNNIVRKWWDTRRERPIRVTGRNKKSRVIHKVDHPAWSDFMNQNAVSPVPPSNVPGSDFAGIEHQMEWEEDFPHDGEYIFKYLADNVADIYLDNQLLGRTKRFKGAPDKIKKFVSAGVHRIRIDLENTPIYEKVALTPASTTPNLPAKREYNIEYSNRVSPTTGKKVVDNNRRIKFDDDATNGFDLNASFTIVSTSPGLKAKFSDDGSKLIVTGQSKGNVTLRLKWDDNPRVSGIAVDKIKINGTEWVQSGKKGSTEKKIKVDKIVTPSTGVVDQKSLSTRSSNQGSSVAEIFNTKEFINKADRKLWRINPNAGRDGDFLSRFGVGPFDPKSEEATTDDFAGTHVIRWESVDFPVSGNYNIETMVDDQVRIFIGNRAGGGRKAIGNGLRGIENGGDEVIITKNGFSAGGRSTGKSSESRYFEAGKYRIRAELKQIPGKPLASGNPMSLAIRIRQSETVKNVVSAKSWNDNPQGVALVIDAPLPPIPQEPRPVAEGRCPNNPVWSTRFPGSRDKWFPVTHPAWSPFTNRYAMSPIPPLSTPDSDSGGQVFRTSWVIEAPYAGFYGMKGTVDNGGRILVDNNEILRGGLTFGGRTLEGFNSEFPQTVKFPLSEGKHTITVEVTNQRTDTFKTVNKKIFSTRDWLTPTKTKTRGGSAEIVYVGLNAANSNGINVTKNGKKINLKDGDGNDTNASFEIVAGDATFSSDGRKISGTGYCAIVLKWNDNPNTAGVAVKKIKINGTTWTQSGRRGKEKNDLTLGSTKEVGLKSGSTVEGVSYSGPQITSYQKGFLAPVIQNINQKPNESIQGREWVMKWANVDFPVKGQYNIKTEVDDEVDVLIDGVKVQTARLRIRTKAGDPATYSVFNATPGKKTVELRLRNIRVPGSGFQQNPTGVKVDIDVPVSVSTGVSRSWQVNPIGVSAILIPPPCPKEVTGRGKICRVVVDDPGNGYPKPPDGGTGASIYPVTLELEGVEVINPGINHNCGVDQIVMEPSNGAQLSYECDTFGRIVRVNVDPEVPARGFTTTPDIRVITDTGTNFQAVPRFRVVRDPVGVDVEPEKIIQVTDLVGLKLTGYVDGRAYYGSVFFKEGVRYAGIYETPGQLIQVYDTLQESIDAEVTTPPSAIQRQGTDVRSNNPRLNIPGTPDSLI